MELYLQPVIWHTHVLLLLLLPSIRSVMQKYLEERDELTFDKIFNQKIGKCAFIDCNSASFKTLFHTLLLVRTIFSFPLCLMLEVYFLNGMKISCLEEWYEIVLKSWLNIKGTTSFEKGIFIVTVCKCFMHFFNQTRWTLTKLFMKDIFKFFFLFSLSCFFLFVC